MENCHNSNWPKPANWADCNAALNTEPSFLLPWPLPPGFTVPSSSSTHFDSLPSWPVPPEELEKDKAATTSKSHSQAEKRRRDRINAQLAALRKLIPKSDKMDKAALLGSAIEHVKDLKQKAVEISQAITLPTEVDEVTVDCDLAENIRQGKDKIFIRASVCCDDRPEVFTELIRVLKGLRLSTVKAEIAIVGGRMKSNLILCNKTNEEVVSPSTLKQSLNVVLSRIASSSSVGSNYRIRSKRQRLFFPNSAPES